MGPGLSELKAADLGVNIRGSGNGDERVERHPDGNMGLYGLGGAADFSSLGSAFSGQGGIC
jgi:hypothetical protein